MTDPSAQASPFAPPAGSGFAPPPVRGPHEAAVSTLTAEERKRSSDVVQRMAGAFGSKVVGQQAVRTSIMVALIAGGHILLESVPGLAKSTAASTLADAVRGVFRRIQCTPDLLPSDILGTQIYDQKTTSFVTRLGPVHANIVLLDEINRSSAKTQSAMLEAMQERQTSIGGEIFPLPDPFLVIATQNPIEQEGTYVLPEAQLDRFLLKEILDYPDASDEFEILRRIDQGVYDRGQHVTGEPLSLDDVLFLQGAAKKVYVSDRVRQYLIALVQATRSPAAVISKDLADLVDFGASPRGSIAFLQAARALALLQGRDHVIPEDVKQLSSRVLAHRMVLSFEAEAADVSAAQIVDAIVRAVPTP